MPTAGERRVLAAIADAVLPRGGTPAPAASDVGVAAEVSRHLEERVTRAAGLAVRAALWGLELAPLLRYGRRFSRLDAGRRLRLLERLSGSRSSLRRAHLDLFKHLVVNTYLSDPGVGAQIGYRRDEHLAACRELGPVPDEPRLSPLTWPDVPPVIRCDVVVIGSGAGGAPVAAVLAEAGRDVVIVEEGGYHDRRSFEEAPVWERFLDLYRDLGITGTVGRPPIPVPLGRAVGGTTVVNAGTCFRTPDDVLLRWVGDLGLAELSPEEMAPVFDEVETVQNVVVPPSDRLGANAEIARIGALKLLGDEGRPLARNCRGCRGCGESVAGCPFGAKQGVQLTWLPRAESAGARIVSRVRADRIVRRDGRVIGVEATVLDPGGADEPRGQVRIVAPTVVVAAGAFHTPLLLQRSDVPDPSGLRGRNLQVHPAVGVVAEMDEDVHAWRGVLQSWEVDALAREHGIMIEATAAPPPVTGGQMPFVGVRLKQLLASASRMATTGFLIEDSTTGRVRQGPYGRALATYQLTRSDERRIALGYSWCAEALLAAGARRVLLAHPGRTWATGSADIRRIREEGIAVEALKLSAYHPVGTHRVAGRAEDGPSDPWGAVRGTAGLWVADASALPSCIGVNPQITIMAFGVRTARRILALDEGAA